MKKIINMLSKCVKVALLPVVWALSCVINLLKSVEEWLNKKIEKDLNF